MTKIKLLSQITISFCICLLIASFACQPAAAQTEEDPDSSCLACHENMGYQSDMTDWFCLCQATPTCVECHGGVTGTYNESIAHENMVAYPDWGVTPRCESCHSEDYEDEVIAFQDHTDPGEAHAVHTMQNVTKTMASEEAWGRATSISIIGISIIALFSIIMISTTRSQ